MNMMIRLVIHCVGVLFLVVSLCSSVYGEPGQSPPLSEQPSTVFRHPHPRILDGFGMSLSLSEEEVLVGAPHAVHRRKESGVAYLMNSRGTLVQTFEMPRPSPGALFGQSVVLTQHSAIVGAPHGYDEQGVPTGAVYVFDRVSRKLRQTLNTPNPLSGIFGHSVAAQENHILVGDPLASKSSSFNVGTAYLFDETTGVLLQTFHPPAKMATRSSQFGHMVRIVGSEVFVSAPLGGPLNSQAGLVYQFQKDSGKLVRIFSPPTPQDSLFFGWSFAVNTKVLLIGAFGFQGTFREEGIAYLFDLSSGKLLNTLDNPSPSERVGFGKSVAFVSGMMVVAAPGDRVQETGKIKGGEVYIFDQPSGSLLQTLHDPLEFTGASDVFGETLVSQDDQLVVGVPFGGISSEMDAGIVYRFTKEQEISQ